MANIYDMTDTWNNGATTFTAIKMDVSDSASAANSLLLDLKVDGVTKASIDKDGNLTANFTLTAIDNVPIGATTPSTGAFTTLTASTIDGAVIGGTTAAEGTFTTMNATSIETTNIKAKDGTSAGSIADSTGVVTFASTVLTTTDINGGTVDGANIGASTPGTGVFTSLETEGAFTEDAEAVTSSSGTATIDLSTATNFTHTLSENVTYTFSNPEASGKSSSFTLKVTQDSTDRTITWPASVYWAGGTAPTISTGSAAVDYFVFITTDGGTAYYGFTAGQALATP